MQNMIGDSAVRKIKCRKCRHLIFDDKQVCNSHGDSLSFTDNSPEMCNPIANVWYIREDLIPTWLKQQVDDADWTKGKIFCPTCKCRIGSFDFVSGSKCQCGSHVLPSLHLVISKLDCENKNLPQELQHPDVSKSTEV